MGQFVNRDILNVAGLLVPVDDEVRFEELDKLIPELKDAL